MHKAYTTSNGSGLVGAPQQTHIEEIIEGIEKVSAEEISSLAQEIFRPDSFSLTVLGPVTEKTIPKTLLAA